MVKRAYDKLVYQFLTFILGSAYSFFNNFKKAQHYFKQARDTCNEINNQRDLMKEDTEDQNCLCRHVE